MKKISKKGFTLVELVVVITIIAIIGGSITSLLVFGYDIFGKVNEDFQAQVDLRSSLIELDKTVRFSKALFAVPGTEYLDDEWNYIGLNNDSTEIINYVWDPLSKSHFEKVLLGPYDGTTFSIKFYKENNTSKDNTIRVYFEMNKQNGTTQRFDVQTGYEALNSLQVVDYGTKLFPATALAYRSDNFSYENFVLKVNITLILDVSGSMNEDLNSNPTLNSSEQRFTILKEKSKGLIESFALNTNDDVQINIAVIPFSSTANNPKVFRNVKTQKSELLGDINSLCKINYYDNNFGKYRVGCEGGTNTGDGLRRAYYQLTSQSQYQIDNPESARDFKIKNYSIFLTDGVTTFRSEELFQSGTIVEEICLKEERQRINKKWVYVCVEFGNKYTPIFETKDFIENGNIQNKETPTNGPVGAYFQDDNNGQSTSAKETEYVAIIGGMLSNPLPVTNYGEGLKVTNYLIGFAGGSDDNDPLKIDVKNIAQVMSVPTNQIYFAADGDNLALSFSEIQLSIVNDTWHYLGPDLVRK